MLLCTGCMLATLGCERRLDPSEAPTVGFFAVGRIELDERQERTREFGLRMALGAREGQVLAMVLREGAWMAGLGVLVGGLASVILARFLRGLLFDVGPGDARTHSAVALLFVFVALSLRGFLPGATRAHPADALRNE